MHVYRVARTMKDGVVGGESCTCPLFQVTGGEGGLKPPLQCSLSDEMTHSDYKMVVMSIAPGISP